jgi:lysyl-tRNA synthetase class 1
MNGVIKEILDAASKIREIYHQISKATKPNDWYPFNVVCQKCQKIGTTYVYKWDGQYVYYRCQPRMVAWAKGCGYDGKISPFDGNGKIPWKVEWPAKWKVIGVTMEGAGKDHMSRGGSHDIASALCKEVFHYPVPYPLAYEWFTVGGRKMSSSKGVGSSAKEVASTLPPDVFRFFIVRTPIETAIDFHPYGDTILNIFDDYDRCLSSYFDKLDQRIPKGKQGEVTLDFARMIELSTGRPLPKKRILIPRFRTIVNLTKAKSNVLNFFERKKGSALINEEKYLLEERIIYVKVYLQKYAQEKEKLMFLNQLPENFNLTENQKQYLKKLGDQLKNLNQISREQIQKIVFNILKEGNFQPKEVFKGFYQTLIGRDFGPKAADLIMDFGVGKILNRLNQAIKEERKVSVTKKVKYIFPDFKDKKTFSIHQDITKKYPSITIGIAIIKGVKIEKENKELNKKIDEFVKLQTGLTTEMIAQYPEIQSYRRVYKEMGIDWHSRRPSPEALLRRIALNKGLYRINSCVDAYNLVVMKYRVSSGAFDLDNIKLPTIMRFPKQGEEILLLGDKEPTKYKAIELAYFDRIGGYNIDFNFRDAQRTAVTEKTKNIIINIDGIYEINRDMVERTLKETINEIINYCGGKLEIAGIITAR